MLASKLSRADELGTNVNIRPIPNGSQSSTIPFKEEPIRRLDSLLQDPIQMSPPFDFISYSIIVLYIAGSINIDDCLREEDESPSQT